MAPAGTLSEIGALFRDLRRVLKVPLPELARSVGTKIEVIEALEQGQLAKLPPWEETARIVTALTGLARIDPRPVLAIMRSEIWKLSPDGTLSEKGSGLERAVAGLKRSAGTARAQAARLGAVSGLGARIASAVPLAVRGRFATLGGTRHGPLVKVAVAVPLLLLAGIAIGPGFVRSSVASVPGAISGLVRSIEDYVLYMRAPERDGLRWIEVDDPRSRKADKLQTSGR